MTSSSAFASILAHLRDDRRYAAMVGLGFSSGIPFLLVYSTQSAWLSEAGVPIQTLGVLAELTIAYKFKFLWSPFLDRYDPPLLGSLLGRRRGWIVVSQLAVILALCGVAFGDPAHVLAWTVAFSLVLGFAGATQDVTIDGWRIVAAPPGKQSLMTAFSEAGYRVGSFVAGAVALLLADRYGWRVSYLCMAAFIAVGAISAFFAPEPESDLRIRRDHPGFVETVVAPIRELVTRLGPMAIPVLVLIAGFRMPGYLTSAMAMPLFKSLHISDTEIATVTKVFGFWISLGGTFLATFVVRKAGLMASLLIGTVAGSASHLALAWLAADGRADFIPFAIAVSIEGFAYAFAQVVLITYMSSLASTELAASQYALLTSLCALPGSFLAGASGFAIARVGFETFFIGTSLIGVPVALLAWFVWRKHRPVTTSAEPVTIG
ncbi:MAG: MFS transporter [Hyphomicrobiales bacterium]|nr:MFS transporter [Hyphomicrobiales bacterium]